MKTKKFLIFAIITLFVLIGLSTSVYAAEVSNWGELKTALEGDATEEITLLNNIEQDGEAITVDSAKTLNLNTKKLTLTSSLVIDKGDLTITGKGTMYTQIVDPLVNVKKGSTLTLENGLFEAQYPQGSVICVTGGATDDGVKTKVTVSKDAEVKANYPIYIPSAGGFGVTVDVYGKVTAINDGENGYTGGGVGLYINGNIQSPTGNVPVFNIYEGAKVVADGGPAVYAAGYGIWNIKGGYLEGTEALSIKGGKFNITGGTLKATGNYTEPIANNNGTEPTGSAISITGNDGYAGKIELNVSNATVSSKNGYAVYETITNAVQPAVKSIKITSGDFSGGKAAIQADNLENFVEGGTFSDDVAEKYLVEDIANKTLEDGTVLVGTEHTITVETTAGGTVEVAKKAIAGEKITIEQKSEEGYKVKALKVVTASGAEVTVKDNTFTMPDSEVTIVAEFEKIESTSGEGEAIPQPTPEQPAKEKDETPKTGAVDVALYAWIAFIAIVLVRKVSKKSKK